MNINGHDTTEFTRSFSSLICDYCNFCSPKVVERNFCSTKMNHCTLCNLDMCWEEKTEEIAIANGATNWKKRSESLLKCFDHMFINREAVPNVVCDVCGESSISKCGVWHLNRVDNIDICSDCISTDDAKKYTEKGVWTVNDMGEHWAFTTGFGSMLEWIPLLTSDEGHLLLYNMVPSSKNYHKTGLACVDDHGRMGYRLVNNTTLTEMVEELRLAHAEYLKVKEKHGDSWETHYSSPIPYCMNQRRWQVYFG